MATRALICFAKREDKVSFSDFKLYDDCGRQRVTHQIYHHYDGAPDFLGVALADFINNVGDKHNGIHCFAAQLLTHLKLGIHYGKCSIDARNVYLETPEPTDICLTRCVDYIYYIWTKDETNEVWISIFDYTGNCIFVGQSHNLIFKYKLNTNANG